MATGDGRAPCTATVGEYPCTGEDYDIICVDSPGLFGCGGAEAEDAALSETASRMSHKPVSLFCFVVRHGVFTAEQMVTIRRIRYMFSQDAAGWDRFCFIVTHVDYDRTVKDKGKDKTVAYREHAEAVAEELAM